MMTAGTAQIRIKDAFLPSSWKLNPRSSQRLGNGCTALFGKANASLWLDLPGRCPDPTLRGTREYEYEFENEDK